MKVKIKFNKAITAVTFTYFLSSNGINERICIVVCTDGGTVISGRHDCFRRPGRIPGWGPGRKTY